VSCWALTSSGDLAQLFVDLSCPRCYIVGEKTRDERSLPTPVTEAGISTVIIPDVGHFVMEKADAFYGALRDFVSHH
jgi:hypothetical protein